MVKKRKKRVESLRYLFDYKIGVVIKLVLAMSSTRCVLKLPLSWSSSYSSIADWELIVHIVADGRPNQKSHFMICC